MSAPAAAYEELLALTERERALVDAEDWPAHEALVAERERLVRTLPVTPPAAARALLVRSAALQEQISDRLRTLAAHADADRVRVGRARRVARGYGGEHAVNQYVDRSG